MFSNAAKTSSQPSVIKALNAVSFVCPSCRGSLQQQMEPIGSYYCEACHKVYSSCAGIPDFRVFPDPFFSVEEDRTRSERILDVLNRYDFTQLLEYYWSLSDITPPLLRRKFVRSEVLGEHRARRIVAMLENGTLGASQRPQRVLDIGSGNGNFLVVAAPQFPQVIGIDIGMRHLHVSRRRFMDRGIAIPALACCCAEYLPFPDGYFDFIVISSTLEIVQDKHRVLSECARTLKPEGTLYVQTVNRYSLRRDPYSYLWGVGFLPRHWQAGYVRWRRDAVYSHIKTMSLLELKRLTATHFPSRQIKLPDVDGAVLPHLPALTRLQIRIYKTLKSVPGLKALLAMVGPEWEVVLRKNDRTIRTRRNSV